MASLHAIHSSFIILQKLAIQFFQTCKTCSNNIKQLTYGNHLLLKCSDDLTTRNFPHRPLQVLSVLEEAKQWYFPQESQVEQLERHPQKHGRFYIILTCCNFNIGFPMVMSFSDWYLSS